MNILDALFGLGGIIAGFALAWIYLSGRAGKLRRHIANVENQLASATGYSGGLKERLDDVESACKTLQEQLAAARERGAALEAKNLAHTERLKAQAEEMQRMQERLKLEFQNTANALFENISTKFTAQSEKKIGDLLTPLQQRLGEFQKMVGESFGAQGKEQHTLKAEIARIVNMNEQMRLQAEGLTKALRGDVKAQGNWGEVMLERILEESGLRKDTDYTTQGRDLGLSDEEGKRQQPDVIIHLPDNKHIIVDAKVSLTAYERFCTESEQSLRDLHLRDYLKSVKSHVNGLEQRKYQHNEKLGTPDFVLMFMPVEGAYSLAVQQDSELHSYAWGKRIVLVCPSTLFATLRTIASIWNIERQNRNAMEIARQGSLLYDKFVGFIKDMNAIGDQVTRLQRTYDDANNKLHIGRGNLVGQADKLKELGIKSAKSLPQSASKRPPEELGLDSEILPFQVAED